MRHCGVKGLRGVGAPAGACVGGNVHGVLSQSGSFIDNGTLHRGVGARSLNALVRCLVRFAKLMEKIQET